MNDFQKLIDTAPNIEILNSFLVTENKLNGCKKAVCSISGGSDSDIVLDICTKVDDDNKVTYVFFDTGLEFKATKEHLKHLEEKYNVKIHIEKAVKPIPTCCRQYGVPFLSKQVSEYIYRLQKHNFQWENKPFEELYKQYPDCKASLKWWCNKHEKKKNGGESSFNIAYNKYLKEFMIKNPPNFCISNKCCHYAKKLVAKKFKEQGKFDLSIQGVRKAEGGVRATAYKNCFTPASNNTIDEYRPVFWYKQDTKKQYKNQYKIIYSDCYEIWGLPRTGCSGCPYAKDFEYELEMVQKYEPKTYKALINVFGESYDYTRKYYEFRSKKKNE